MVFDESVVIDAEADALFRLSQDYRRRLEWDPFLSSACLVGDAREAGVGVRALCVARNGLAMETEYVTFNPPRSTAIKMTSGPWFLRSFAGSWRFEEVAHGRTRVSFRYSLRTQPKWLCWLLTPIVSSVFARDTRRRLRALKRAVEGQPAVQSRN
jgi:ribosome-associated toxin RatA of RatAB toxin-antitoxin module